MSKFEIAITTLLIGFFIGQATDFIKYKWQIKRKKKALNSEILDVRTDFQEKLQRIKQVVTEMDPSHIGIQVPGKVSTVIFDKYFAEVSPYLSENERKSVITIYNHVTHFNTERDEGFRNTFTDAKKSVFLLHNQCLFGQATSNFYLENGGEKLFLKQEKMILEINKEIQEFAKFSEIISYKPIKRD
ncbi:hypothetical protein [Colwellia sp. PAMC 21821]|uniref:hypothetical protein n=1 Tax=Colwellia sp. PAMC 21821 TaxID=1816219 RepID=UPI0009BFA6F5|nr:hypothetical protein [Colwellia sp. PAMC 21821]ARD45290.1 hypothetical protein A3Q33_13895 [Colwellia sp. PAMC 21821]